MIVKYEEPRLVNKGSINANYSYYLKHLITLSLSALWGLYNLPLDVSSVISAPCRWEETIVL